MAALAMAAPPAARQLVRRSDRAGFPTWSSVPPAPSIMALVVIGILLAVGAAITTLHRYADLALAVTLVLSAAAVTWLVWRLLWAERQTRTLVAEQDLLRQSEERFRALAWSTSDVVLILGSDAAIQYQSPAAERIWGHPRQSVRVRDLFELVHPDDLPMARDLFIQALQSPRLSLVAELRLEHTDGSWCHFEVTLNNLLRDRALSGIVATCRDVTERKAFEAQLAHQAFHDVLTRLPNRALFMERLERALARSARRAGSVAVLFLDLDNFKLINDSLGHQVGDQLIGVMAERILGCLRREDTAARLGGDEFAVLLEDIADIDDARAFAERIQEQLQVPLSLAGQEVVTTVSIGIAVSEGEQEEPADLLRKADLAMYQAKGNGKGRHERFEQDMDTRAVERLALETDLRHAIERGEFEVHYQPIVDLATGRVSELEALIRWRHPQRGLVSPAEFIPVAEETGLILAIGRWMLEEACWQTRVWQARYPTDRPLALSVNLSARELHQPNLVEDIMRISRETGLDPASLVIEITESVMMTDAPSTIETLRRLKQIGISLSVDDFGTGYSSLAYLKRFPIDSLKIDRSFVAGLGQDHEDTAIVHSIVTLAKTLNLRATAEGIETAQQMAELSILDCNRGQGYHIARPLPSADIDALLRASLGEPLALRSAEVGCPA